MTTDKELRQHDRYAIAKSNFVPLQPSGAVDRYAMSYRDNEFRLHAESRFEFVSEALDAAEADRDLLLAKLSGINQDLRRAVRLLDEGNGLNDEEVALSILRRLICETPDEPPIKLTEHDEQSAKK